MVMVLLTPNVIFILPTLFHFTNSRNASVEEGIRQETYVPPEKPHIIFVTVQEFELVQLLVLPQRPAGGVYFERTGKRVRTLKSTILVGWNDAGWLNRFMETPTLNKLAKDGVLLTNYYSGPNYLQSMAATLSGHYPFHIGASLDNIHPLMAHGVSEVPFLSQHLKMRGYSTHYVGKWGMGYCKNDYLPTSRGFDTFYGFLNDQQHYSTHITSETCDDTVINDECIPFSGYDFWANNTLFKDAAGKDTETLFWDQMDTILESNTGEPMFIVSSFQSFFGYHEPSKISKLWCKQRNIRRNHFCRRVFDFDTHLQNFLNKIEETVMLNNTILIFASNSAGRVPDAGNNYPCRGSTGSLWEGGLKLPALIYAPTKLQPGKREQLIHAVDWYSTILYIVTGEHNNFGDGMNQWEMLVNETNPGRSEIVHNIGDNAAAIRSGAYKYIRGDPGLNIREPPPFIGQTYFTANRTSSPNDRYLFNIQDDLAEEHNLVTSHSNLVHQLQNRLDFLTTSVNMSSTKIPQKDARGLPRNGAFRTGWC